MSDESPDAEMNDADEYDPEFPTDGWDSGQEQEGEQYDPEFPTDGWDSGQEQEGEQYDPEFPTDGWDSGQKQQGAPYDPEFPTDGGERPPEHADAMEVDDDTGGGVGAAPTATATSAPELDYAVLYPTELSHASDRVQGFGNNQYAWHRSRPGCYVDTRTSEFIDGATQRGTGQYVLQVNLFEQRPLRFPARFYLVPRGRRFEARPDSSRNPPAGSVFVPWRHIMQHTYAHMTDFDIKEAHTFWPPGTTEEDVLAALVADLNDNNGEGIVWESDYAIKTFFLWTPESPTDKYTVDQMSDLGDLLRAMGSG